MELIKLFTTKQKTQHLAIVFISYVKLVKAAMYFLPKSQDKLVDFASKRNSGESECPPSKREETSKSSLS